MVYNHGCIRTVYGCKELLIALIALRPFFHEVALKPFFHEVWMVSSLPE